MSGWLNDTSGKGHIATAQGVNGGTAPTYDLTNKKFGSSSAKFTRTSDYVGGIITLPSSDDWWLDMTWTWQMWIKTNGWNDAEWGVMNRDDESGQRGWYALIGHTEGTVDSSYHTVNDKWPGTDHHGAVQTDGNWHHLMMCRSNPNWHYFVDGVLRYYHDASGTYGYDQHLANVNMSLALGCKAQRSDFYGHYFNGWIDAFHIEKGIARYTGTSVGSTYFDPNALGEPTATSYSVLLMNFNEIRYQINGTVSAEARITVIDSDSRTIEYDGIKSAGAYSIDVDDDTEKTVIAERVSDGSVLGYGRIIPTTV